MRYYLDTEFNGFGGQLLSLALVREDGASRYIVYDTQDIIQPWVAENVLPIMSNVPDGIEPYYITRLKGGAHLIASFMMDDSDPVIVTDWPEDIRYFCQAIITGPGAMINLPSLKFEMHRVDAYPTTLPGAVQHNAWWDAMALRHKLTAMEG